MLLYNADMPISNLQGQRFGRVLVGARSTNDDFGRVRWRCNCDCGSTVVIIGNHLASGNTKSCGCISREKKALRFTQHGYYGTPTHTSWQTAKQRCFNPNSPEFHNYAGRGITMCQKWANDFAEFLRDMGERPNGKTLDRIDNDGNYEPGNCRWATPRQQLNNTRRNMVLELNGERMTAIQWSRHLGLSARTIHDRIRKGWTVERVLSTRHRH
jgi:hypothetical protein